MSVWHSSTRVTLGDMVSSLPAHAEPGILQLSDPWTISLPAGRVGFTGRSHGQSFLTGGVSPPGDGTS